MPEQELDFDEPVGEDVDDDLESTYNPKSEFKKPVLAMEAVRACREARAKEMKKGFWNNKLDKEGNAIRTWVEDGRKIYINSVIALELFLSSECEKDEKYKSFSQEINNTIKNIFDKYAYTIFEFDALKGGWRRTQNKFIPQVEEELLVPSPQDPRVLMNIKGAWDFKVNAYYDELVPIYDKVFQELNKVIYRLDDFVEKVAKW